MCGIVGIVDSKETNLANVVGRMSGVLFYRGPDGHGKYVEATAGVALGHRRLSILDLSSTGAQPMHDSTEQVIIVHNGEVYNYLELRSELEGKGYSFRSKTDTEVILNAFLEWGAACLERFNGMFAFAIFDKKRQSLFIARDRLGIKPLYYYWDGRIFLFASEVKAILAGLPNVPSLNDHLIDQYMSFGYIPGEDTLHQKIKRLLPGHHMVLQSGELVINEYWDFSFDNKEDKGLEYYQSKTAELLNDSIDLRLRSDVPLGIFLSGGIDSSAVVALLASRVKEPLKTYSVAYDFGSAFNETNYAKLVARQFGTDHHEFIVSPAQFKDFIPDYIWHMDEPVTESAAISLYYIARMARESVTVVLSGEGSDEIFAGYDFYYYNKMIEAYRKHAGIRAASFLSEKLSALLPPGKVRKYMQMSGQALEQRYKGISTYEEAIKSMAYSRDFHEQTNILSSNNIFFDELFRHTRTNDALSRMLYFDTRTWLVDDLLIKADRMTMAASLELRVPFLDHRLVEFAAAMPSKYKLNGRTNKYILKKLMQGMLPDEIINRKKMGFPTPLQMMFRNELYEYASDILLSDSFRQRGYFKMDVIEKVLATHKKGIQDNHRLIWQLLVLEEWHRKFINV